MSLLVQVYLLTDDLHFDDIQRVLETGRPISGNRYEWEFGYAKCNFIKHCIAVGSWSVLESQGVAENACRRYCRLW